MSKKVLDGADEHPWPRGFQMGATPDKLLIFSKSGEFRGHLKEVWGGSGDPKGVQIGEGLHT